MGEKEAQTWEAGGWVIARLNILVQRHKVQVCAELFILAAPATDWGSPFALRSQKLWEEFTGAGWQKATWGLAP